MATRSTPVHDTALPLLRRINDGRFTKAEAARSLGVLPQHITNWLARGIPAAQLHRVAALCKLTTDQYRAEAGLPVNEMAQRQTAGLTPDETRILDAYRAASGTWKAVIAVMVTVSPDRQDRVAAALLPLAAEPVADAKVKKAFGKAPKHPVRS